MGGVWLWWLLERAKKKVEKKKKNHQNSRLEGKKEKKKRHQAKGVERERVVAIGGRGLSHRESWVHGG